MALEVIEFKINLAGIILVTNGILVTLIWHD